MDVAHFVLLFVNTHDALTRMSPINAAIERVDLAWYEGILEEGDQAERDPESPASSYLGWNPEAGGHDLEGEGTRGTTPRYYYNY